jgi:hypothetical protein
MPGEESNHGHGREHVRSGFSILAIRASADDDGVLYAFNLRKWRLLMKNVVICGLILVLGLVLGLEATARISRPADPKLAHMVFFWLKDHSKESRDRFIASCEKLLSNHEGAVYFSVGTRAADVDEPVSVKDFDVALHVVFAGKEGKLKYLKSPRHDQFVKDNGVLFEKVQVFDSYLMPE